MSVLIKGMEMPKSCLICVCDIPKGNCDLWRNQTPEEHRRERHPDCPLIEVPTPHGRLIDADALKEKMKIVTRTWDIFCDAVQEIVEYDINAYKVDDAPTIIESEDE